MKMRSTSNAGITLGVVAALATAIVVLHSLVYLSIQPGTLSAALPRAVVHQSK